MRVIDQVYSCFGYMTPTMGNVTIIGIVASIFIGISMLPQLVKIIKEKQAKNVPILMLVILIIGIGSCEFCGILKTDLIIIIYNSFGSGEQWLIFLTTK